MSTKEVRRHPRIPYRGRVRFSWEDAEGHARFAAGKCVDVSLDGLRIEVLEAIPRNSRVSIQAEQINLSGSAFVKHVERQGSKYVLGLGLSQTLLDRTLTAIREIGTVAKGASAE